MKRIAAVAVLSLVMAPFLCTVDEAWARAGRGGFSGSRGSRGFSAPVPPISPPVRSPAAPTTPHASSAAPRASARPSPAPASGGLGGMMGGLIAGGLVGSLLFGGGGGSVGLMDLVVLGLLGYLAMRKLRTPEAEPIRVEASSPGGAVHAPAARALDERGAAWPDLAPAGDQARRPAPLVDNAEAAQAAADIFRSVQSAWAARDMDRVAALVTPEMRASFQKDCDQLRARGRINRIDDITVRAAEVVEAWQEAGRNYATVRIEASLLDYTTDEKTGQVVEGSQTEPVTVEEHWTLTRAVWVKAWRLSAIQQPAPASS